MSPEQAELTPLSVDTRSDVYSLGAVLYELLVGVRPFEFDAATSQLDIRQTVQSAEPDPPSTRLAKLSSAESEEIARLRRSTPAALRRLLGGELGWVTARALAKDPNRRYQSAQALAEDIDRYLNARPVTAGPESLGYRLGKFVRRNRAAVASVAIVLVALVGGLALASLGFIEARQERDLAQQARDESEAVTAFLERMLAAADPAEKGRDVTVLEILDDASGRVGEEFSDRPLLEARLRGTIGETYRELGVLDPSAQHLERQLAIYEARLDADDPVRIAAQHQLAWIYAEQGRLNEAAALYEKTLADRRRVLGEEDRETLRTMNNLGLLYADQDRFDEAERIMEDVLETRERTLGLRHPDTLVAMNNLALLYGKQGRHEQSAALHIKEYELTREVLGEEHPDTLISLSNVAYSYDILDRAEESERAYREGLVLSERVVGPDHPTTLMMQNNLGAVLARAGRLEESEQHLRQALAGRQRVLGQSHHATLLTSASLGTNLLKQGRAPEAEPYLRQAAERGADSLPPDSIRLARFRAQYGHCLLALERFDEAEPLLFSAERSLAAASEGGVTAVDETLAQARGDLAALEERRQPLP
jgi:tetratricopeptide (TPR) repeat protein